MISSVDFISRAVFQELTPTADMLAISIGDFDQVPPGNLSGFAASLRLTFLDCDDVDVALYQMSPEVLFSPEQLESVARFVSEHHATAEPFRLVVHCSLGSSRSAAIALVAWKMTDCDFPRYADAHHANAYVLRAASAMLGSILAPQKVDGPEPHPYRPCQLQI